MPTLVTGGAGYIGSHTVMKMLEQGRDVVVYDNLSKGHRGAVKGCPLVVGDIFDTSLLEETIRKYKIDDVIHFAAYSLVGESMIEPIMYYRNNLS
ncbi:MAG TPA: GDP-mannose 4,6-dehydratase, partial [Clostridia bacterium]|nr:GDP-mannose 4,6-dehydratase [Clostridia bacterium]